MKTCRITPAVIALFAFFHVPVSASEPPPYPLAKETAQRLISEFIGVRTADVAVATLIRGEETKKGFTAKPATKAVYVAPRFEEGGKTRRRAGEIVFQYNSEYGWHLLRIHCGDFQDTVEIWSERCGCIHLN